jgi:hypothetical protein
MLEQHGSCWQPAPLPVAEGGPATLYASAAVIARPGTAVRCTGRAADRVFEHHRRDHPGVTQARDEGGGFPVAVRDGSA